MRPLGQVLTDGSKVECGRAFKVIADISEAEASLPLLIVGYAQAKRLIEGFSPLRKAYGNVRWTFGRRENRSQQEADVREFCKSAVDNAVGRAEYRFVDVNMMGTDRVKGLLSYLSSGRPFYYYVASDCHGDPSFIYVFDMAASKVYGLSVSTITAFHNVRESTIRKWISRRPSLRRKEKDCSFKGEMRAAIGGDKVADLVLWALSSKCTDEEFSAYMAPGRR